jgi:hypothetical protein
MTGLDDRHKRLLARRIPLSDVVVGRAYVIYARNGGVGVAIMQDDRMGYELHREKFGSHFLFIEEDWDYGPPHGTAIPLAVVSAEPPRDGRKRLGWLTAQEAEHRAEINAAWEVILGPKLAHGLKLR